MKLLIVTEPDDKQAIFVKLALESMGHDAVLFFTADQPTKQKNSIFIDEGSYQWKSSDKYNRTLAHDCDVVWWRHARKPYIPKDLVHPKDYKFVLRENVLFHESLTDNMAPDAWWINPKRSARLANSTLLQLKIARECGLAIPITMCSNDPKEIRLFLLKHEKDGVIYKTLSSNLWFEDNQIKRSYPINVNFLDLPNNRLLQLTPGIFQKQIMIKHALRIVCFGDHIVAAKLKTETPAESHTLPDEIENKIKLFMNKMGLVFGVFDFILNQDNTYVFSELNEQGDFLWIEESNAEFKMLDRFIHFLINRSKRFKWDNQNPEHTIEKYKNKMNSLLLQNMNHHVDLSNIHSLRQFFD